MTNINHDLAHLLYYRRYSRVYQVHTRTYMIYILLLCESEEAKGMSANAVRGLRPTVRSATLVYGQYGHIPPYIRPIYGRIYAEYTAVYTVVCTTYGDPINLSRTVCTYDYGRIIRP